MATLDDYINELKEIEDFLTNDFDVSLERLEALKEAIEADMEALKSDSYTKPPKKLQEGTAKECSGEVKLILQEEFARAATKTTGDINSFMVSHLNDMVQKSVKPDISIRGLFGRSARAKVRLERPCRNALGRPKDWFDIVDKAREAGGFGTSTDVQVRMATWARIFSVGTGLTTLAEDLEMEQLAGGGNLSEKQTNIAKSRHKKAASLYRKTMRLRYQFLSNIAPYWYFLEHGNEEFAGGRIGLGSVIGTSPFPRYGAPNAVTKAEKRAEAFINEKLLQVANEHDQVYEKGYEERQSLLREVNRLIADLETIDIYKLSELVRKQISKYHGQTTLQQMDDETIERIIAKVLAGIRNKEFRVIDRGLPGSGKMRTLGIHKQIGLYNVRRAQKRLRSLGL